MKKNKITKDSKQFWEIEKPSKKTPKSKKAKRRSKSKITLKSDKKIPLSSYLNYLENNTDQTDSLVEEISNILKNKIDDSLENLEDEKIYCDDISDLDKTSLTDKIMNTLLLNIFDDHMIQFKIETFVEDVLFKLKRKKESIAFIDKLPKKYREEASKFI